MTDAEIGLLTAGAGVLGYMARTIYHLVLPAQEQKNKIDTTELEMAMAGLTKSMDTFGEDLREHRQREEGFLQSFVEAQHKSALVLQAIQDKANETIRILDRILVRQNGGHMI